MTTPVYAREIEDLIEGDIDVTENTLEAHSKDTSIFKVRPTIVVFPKNEDDIVKLVRFVNQKNEAREKNEVKLTLTARSAGTCMSGGSLTESIQLDMTRYLNHIIEAGDGFATSEPGVFYRDFEVETLKHGYIMPSYPASRELCAIGGIVNNNSGGEKTLTYGKTEKYIRSVRLVLADGSVETFKKLTLPELTEKIKEETLSGKIHKNLFSLISDNFDDIQNAKPQVSKNSAGYYLWNVYNKDDNTFDIPKLIAGSQGTFGMMTQVTFDLIKPKEHSRMLVIFLKDLAKLPEIVSEVLAFKPESFESYDDHTFKIAMKFFPDIAKRMKGNLFTLGIQFIPEFLMVLSGGVPKLVLMAEFAGDTEEEVDTQMTKAYDKVISLGYTARAIHSQREAKKYWTFRRESFNLLRSKMRGLRTAPFIDDFVVRPEFLPEFLPKLEKVLSKYNLIYTVAGHIGNGNFHIIPLMDLHEDKSIEVIESLSKEVYDLIKEFKGSITGEHNDGLVRTPFLFEMYSEKILDLFKETKAIFDKDTIFNPGKKVDGDLAYSFEHIDRTHA